MLLPIGASDPAAQSLGLSVTSTSIEGRLSPTCLKNLRWALLVRSLPRSPGNELGHHPGLAFPATPRKARVPTLSLMASPSHLSPNAHRLLRCSSCHGRDGSSEGRPALGGKVLRPTPRRASGPLLQNADLTVHSQSDGQGRLWTRADMGHTIAGSL